MEFLVGIINELLDPDVVNRATPFDTIRMKVQPKIELLGTNALPTNTLPTNTAATNTAATNTAAFGAARTRAARTRAAATGAAATGAAPTGTAIGTMVGRNSNNDQDIIRRNELYLEMIDLIVNYDNDNTDVIITNHTSKKDIKNMLSNSS